MTDHTPTAFGLPLGSDGCAWWSVADALAVPAAVAATKATATGTDVGAGNIASAYGPSVSIAA